MIALRIALDYSARDAILRAAQFLPPDVLPTRESFARLLSIVDHGGTGVGGGLGIVIGALLILAGALRLYLSRVSG